MKFIFNKVNLGFSIIVALLAIGVATFGIMSALPGQRSIHAMIIRGGSMQPILPVGSLVVIRASNDYQPGDMITYRAGEKYVTHRIVRSGPKGFVTQGDANNQPDSRLVTSDMIAGRVRVILPWVGAFLAFIRTPLGYGLVVILPALAIVFNEALVIFRELQKKPSQGSSGRSSKKRLIQKKIQGKTIIITESRTTKSKAVSVHAARTRISTPRKNSRRTTTKKTSPAFRYVQGGLALLLIFSMAGSTHAYFSDASQSTENVFTTIQRVNGLVINEVLYQSSCRNPSAKQWIELWNGSNAAINLKHWKIIEAQSGATGTIYSKEIIKPGEFIVISRSEGAFSNGCYGRPPSDRLVIDLGCEEEFSSTQGIIQLVNPENEVVDQIEYGGAGQPSAPVDQSIERRWAGYDTASGDSFTASDFVTRFPSTSGFALPSSQELVINEFQIKPNKKEFIEIYNPTDQVVSLNSWTIRSEKMRIISSLGRHATLSGGQRKTITYDDVWPSGGQKIYLVNPAGAIVDAFNYHQFDPERGESWARISDGQVWKLDLSPTPDTTNTL